MFTLEFEQNLPLTPQQAWDFFSNPRNLAEITPAHLQFEITSAVPDKIYPGLIITYRIRPFLALPLNWVTEITHAQEPVRFIDEQRSGPYRFWHHTHTFLPVDGGIRMTDLVHYCPKPPLFSRFVNMVIVKQQLERIFTYRRETLTGMFGHLSVE